jgi:hypothetical protein
MIQSTPHPVHRNAEKWERGIIIARDLKQLGNSFPDIRIKDIDLVASVVVFQVTSLFAVLYGSFSLDLLSRCF